MTAIVMNCISNLASDPALGEEFDEHFVFVKERVQAAAQSVSHSGDLVTLYIQLQFDCRGMPSAVVGFKISRYSTKHKDVQCAVEVSRKEFKLQPNKRPYLLSRVRDTIILVENDLRGRVANNLSDILPRLADDLVSS